MLGSNCTFFTQPERALFLKRRDVRRLLQAKGYNHHEIEVYLIAYDYFTINKTLFDGATIVKDLCDIIGLDLDAMLHDYHYIVCNAGSNFVTKFQADWMYAKGNERKGKGQYSAFSRFIGLTIAGIGFVPYAYFKRGKISVTQKEQLANDYKVLIK
jgi:hypothetical protein